MLTTGHFQAENIKKFASFYANKPIFTVKFDTDSGYWVLVVKTPYNVLFIDYLKKVVRYKKYNPATKEWTVNTSALSQLHQAANKIFGGSGIIDYRTVITHL